MPVERYWDGTTFRRIRKESGIHSFGGGIDLEEDAVYPNYVAAGIVPTVSNVATITSTPGNFLLAVLLSRSDDPIVSAPGWKVQGGFAGLRRELTITQRIWVLSKISTGNDTIEFNHGELFSISYIIYYEFTPSEINIANPINIGCGSICFESSSVYAAKSVDKLIIWVGNTMYYYSFGYAIWGCTSDPLLQIINRIDGLSTNFNLATIADYSRLTDAPIGSGTILRITRSPSTSYGTILPIAINHA